MIIIGSVSNPGRGDGNVRNFEKKCLRNSRSLQLFLFVSWLKFLPFRPKFYCFHGLQLQKSDWGNFSKCLKSHARGRRPQHHAVNFIYPRLLLLSSTTSSIVLPLLQSPSPDVLVLKLSIRNYSVRIRFGLTVQDVMLKSGRVLHSRSSLTILKCSFKDCTCTVYNGNLNCLLRRLDKMID